MIDLTQINLEDVKFKLYERLKPSGWADKLKTFILSDAFDSILMQLLSEVKANDRFTPTLKQVFRAFEECPYDDLKVVMIGQDPYSQVNVADGIAYSANNGTFTPPALRFIFKEIEATVYPKGGYIWNTDLARWSNQGILLINTAFTTPIGKIGKHYAIWHPFIAFLLDILSSHKPGITYVFMGKVAKEWAEYIPDNNNKLYTTHPSSASHTLKEHWDSDDLFNKINEFLIHKITW